MCPPNPPSRTDSSKLASLSHCLVTCQKLHAGKKKGKEGSGLVGSIAGKKTSACGWEWNRGVKCSPLLIKFISCGFWKKVHRHVIYE